MYLSVFIIALISTLCQKNLVKAQDDNQHLTYSIKTEWNGEPIKHQPTNITISVNSEGSLTLDIEATFFNTTNPNAELVNEAHCPQRPTDHIYIYEVVEAFFLNDAGDYYQLELAPNGQYSNHLFSGYRDRLLFTLPMFGMEPVVENNCENSGIDKEEECVWTARVTIPREFLPKDVTKFNAAAIHNEFVEGERITRYEALYPTGEDVIEADFHYFEAFQEIDLTSIAFSTKTEPELWTQAKSEDQFITRDFKLTRSFDCLKEKSEDSIFHTERGEGHLKLNVSIINKSPFKANIPEALQASGTNEELFNDLYESAWVTFSNARGQSLRVGLNPYGTYQISLLSNGEIRKNIVLDEPLDCKPFEQLSWACQVEISNDLFPMNVTQFQMVHYHTPLFNETTNERDPENEIIATICPGTLEGAEREIDWVGCETENRLFVDDKTNAVVSQVWAELLTETTTVTDIPDTTESTETSQSSDGAGN
ncbi:hypothetical protein TCAL_13079 [Tigriopus californicus]|uniref:Uncharacterized protein n=1 Tax=Tigriopus californicus TaxID=6832 RepID=A0A553PT09_TIGCA|nr:uncharacterized protein LOC131892145 [Tigriopus californicus]TRY80805.1 hypothetical protein TCAL_13079 [Tigriopus californicus]|eukprot:TCALIF_13079-PA protein Name:"Similar to C4orf33 UPF0462 protein C4orf33 (Homo sapiens)" AED:0.23 eAED:0.24 QI:0/-1/0/1/-1/1/1/0/480